MAAQFPLFNVPSIQDAQVSDYNAGMQEDMAMANMDPLSLPRFHTAQAGRQLGGAVNSMFGVDTPAVQKAKAMQEVMARTQKSGIDFTKNPDKYMDEAIRHSMELGQYELAQQIVAQKAALSKASVDNQKTLSEVNKNNAEAAGVGGTYAKNMADAGKAKEETRLLDFKAQTDRLQATYYGIMAKAQQATAAGNQQMATLSKVTGQHVQNLYGIISKKAELMSNPSVQSDPALQQELQKLTRAEEVERSVLELSLRQLSMTEGFTGSQPFTPSPAAGNQTTPPPAPGTVAPVHLGDH